MERGEFISYVEREQAHLRRFLLALCCGNADEADDIAQDALVKAYLSSSSYNDEGKFGVWICKIAYNTFLDRKRASKQSDTLDEATLVQDDTFAADRKKCYDAGMSGYIPKPIDLETITHVLEEETGE